MTTSSPWRATSCVRRSRSIQGYAEHLLDDPIDGTRTDAQLEIVVRRARSMSDLIDDLFDLAKLDIPLTSIAFAPVALDELVEESVHAHEPHGRQRDITIKAVTEPVNVIGDRARLRRMCDNVIDNAVKYSSPEGHVTVSVTTEGDEAVLVVADQGIGIPADDLPHVFERLYRADNAVDARYPGTGLGLSITLATAQGHGGTAAAESSPGSGTVFTIRLPLHELDAAPDEPWDSPRRPAPGWHALVVPETGCPPRRSSARGRQSGTCLRLGPAGLGRTVAPAAANPHPGAADRPARRHQRDRRRSGVRALQPRHPQPVGRTRHGLSLAIGVPVYVGVAIFIGASWGTAGSLRALRWSTEGREPDEAERVQALGVPWFLTRIQAGLWLGATVLFTLLAADLPARRARSPPVSRSGSPRWWSAGSPSCSPSSRCARSRPGRCRARSGCTCAVSAYDDGWCSSGDSAPALRWSASWSTRVLALTPGDISVTKLAVVVLALGAVVLVFGLLVTCLNARAVVAPILAVRDAMEQVEEGHLDAEVPVYDGTELGQLQTGFNQMVARPARPRAPARPVRPTRRSRGRGGGGARRCRARRRDPGRLGAVRRHRRVPRRWPPTTRRPRWSSC